MQAQQQERLKLIEEFQAIQAAIRYVPYNRDGMARLSQLMQEQDKLAEQLRGLSANYQQEAANTSERN